MEQPKETGKEIPKDQQYPEMEIPDAVFEKLASSPHKTPDLADDADDDL